MPQIIRTKPNKVVLGGLVLFFCLFPFITLAANSPPAADSITPALGKSQPNQKVSLTAVYSDPDGASNIYFACILVSEQLNPKKGLYAYYNKKSKLLYLRSPDNTAWWGGYAPGSQKTIRNAYAILDCANTKVSVAGKTLTISWSIIFKPYTVGFKNIYLLARDLSDNTTKWRKKGSWYIAESPKERYYVYLNGQRVAM
ncbi:MAG: hypothetical protein WCY12_06475, partial [Candidatus Omnitrophota bacterium]